MASTLSPLQPTQETVQETRSRMRLLAPPLDPLLSCAAIGLSICSVITILAATRTKIPGDPHYYGVRQAVYLGIGFVAMVALSRLDYGLLRRVKYWIYGTLIFILLAVLAIGSSTLGSTRAISLPLFSFQSSEIGKVLLIAFVACYLVDRRRALRGPQSTARTLALALVPMMLVVAEPDIGSSLVYVSIAVVVLFVAGVPWRHFAAVAALAAVALALVLALAPTLGVKVLSKYQEERLTGFLNTSHHVVSSESERERYQQEESKIAIGAGQQTGLKNVGSAQLGYVPYDESDFVFASVGEQYGFVGAALVLSLYALLIWRALRILTMAKDLLGALLAAGVTAMLMCQVFVNVGVAVGIMPDTGITLPLMSYGGSSVISTMLAIGLLQSVYVRARSSNAIKNRAPVW